MLLLGVAMVLLGVAVVLLGVAMVLLLLLLQMGERLLAPTLFIGRGRRRAFAACLLSALSFGTTLWAIIVISTL